MMLSFNPFKKSLFIILTLLLISSCGGGGGDSAPSTRAQGTITGVVFDAPVSGATVEIFEYKNGSLGRKLGSDITSASGHYSIDIESASMPLYISAKGGGYEDPFSHNAVYGSKGKPVYLASVTNYSEGSTQQVMVTPLTYLVTGLTEYRIKQGRAANSTITSSVKDVSELYGFDVNTTQPVDLTLNVTSNVTNGHKYGAVLAAYSSYAWEFLKPNSDEGKDTYTSLHLADLGYQDITFDGKLNGLKRDEGGQFSDDVEFGSKATLDADFYTHIIAQHIMSAVSNPEINRTTGYQDFADFIKSPSFDQYKALADELSKVNGSNENPDEIFPQRYNPGEQPPSIDDTPPTVDYPKEGDVLAGQDIIALNLADNVGLASARVVVAYKEDKLFDSWTELGCPFGQENAQLNCWVDDSNFTVGKREASLTVHLNTEVLGDGNTNSDSDAKLLVYVSDIINQSEEEVSVDIKWDNSAPVIVVTSAESVNSLPTDYLLTGYVKKDPQLLEDRSVWIALSSGEYSKYSCSNYPSGSAIWCGFSYTESGLNFDQSVAFSIRAKDIYGNQATKEFILYQDVMAPKASLTYPDAQFNFQRLEGESFPSIYESSTYTKENVEDATKYLLIDYDYASKGARQVFSDLDLTKLENPDVFQRNSLPYVTLTISDENGTSADNLKVTVEYYSKRRGEAEFILRGTRVQTASEVTADNVYFPFNLNKGNDSFLPSMTLYIPFSRDAFKDEFAKALSSDIQKLRITVEDAAGNLSYNKEATGGNQGTLIEAFFRSTFDKPVVTVVSPFSNARVVLAGLNASTGAFNLIKTCDAALGDEGKDIVKCLLTREQEREFYKVYLDDFSASGEPHYFQWSKDIKTLVDLSYEVLGDDIDGDKVPVHSFSAYFVPNKDTTIYITEFASYHAGLFDSQWDELEDGDKTAAKAKEILSQVNSALVTQSDSMLGFDPVLTPYASTKELDEEGVPAKLASKHIYRFLLEGLTELANANYATSVDYAKAFYRDLSKDGKADGQGSIYDDQGNESTGQIILGDSGKALGPDTYRKDLAEAYYGVATSYDVERKDALNQADHFAKANPIYADDNVFNQEGSSIDNTPPSISVQPNEQQSDGAFFGDGSTYTISGKIESKVTITDDKTTVKINEGDFTVFWVDPQGTEHEATDTKFERSDDSTEYTETYNFVINSKSDKYHEAKQFNIVVKAQDSIGNFDSQTFVYLVDNQIPVIKRVTVDPEFPVVDTEAEFTVEFEEPVTLEPGTVKIGGAEISFENPQEYRTVWQSSARVSVEANKESTQLTIDSSYFDRVRNQGTEGYEQTIFVEPLITIDNVTENNEVNAEEDDVEHVVISGTTKGFKRTALLTVDLVSHKEGREGTDKVSGLKVNLDSNGRWETDPINMSTWEYSEFTVTVSGKYAEGERSVVATKEALYDDKIKPEVVGTLISYDGEEFENVLVDDKSAKVTLTFNERVTIPTAYLNGQAISFEETDFSKVWVGTTEPLMLPSGRATAPLIVVERTYQDTRPQGNFGEGYTTDIPLKPVITLNDMGGSINASDATEFIVSGTSKGFQTGAELEVLVENDANNGQDYHQTIQVNQNGDWQTKPHDISDWYQGTITITVTGKNSAGQETELSRDVVFRDNKKPTVTGVTEVTPSALQDGQLVSLTVHFSEPVKALDGSFAGVSMTFSKTSPDEAASEWQGVTNGPIRVGAGNAIAELVLSQFKDVSNNGVEHEYRQSYTVMPEISISDVSGDNRVETTELADVLIAGGTTGFASTGESVTLQVMRGATELINERLSVNGDGSWGYHANLSGEEIGDLTIRVNGSNRSGDPSSVAAEEATSSFTIIDLVRPTVTGVTEVTPSAPQDGQLVSLKVHFSEPVKELDGSFAGVSMTFSKASTDEAASVWQGVTTGPITVGAGNAIAELVLSQFKDVSNNNVESEYRQSYTVMPEISISDVSGDNRVETTELADVLFAGGTTGFASTGESVTLQVMRGATELINERVSVNGDGSWGYHANLSGEEIGDLTIRVNGSNRSGDPSSVAAEEATSSFTIIDLVRPTVTGVTEVTPSALQDGQLVSLTVHFSEPVKALVGSFAGVSMTFSKTSPDEAASEWQGVTNGPIRVGAGNAIAELVLSQFKDVSNNNVESEYRQSYTVMPEISISDVSGDNRVETTELADVLIAGGTTGFASTGESVTLQVMRGATELINERVSVNGDGSWGYHANLSGEEIGDLTIKVNGSNRSGNPSSVAAEEATSSFTIIDLVRPTVTGVTEVTPSALQDGQLVSLTVHFSEPVKELDGSFAGVSMTFSKTSPDEAASEWQGVTNGPIRVGAGNAIAELVLSQFKDVSNNGVEHEYRQSYTVMPEISISDVSGDNRVETTELADVLIAGGTTGFASTGESVTLQVMRGATELINERLSVNGDGSWGYHANLSGEEIGDLTIRVNGSNRSGDPSSVAAEEATSSFTIIDLVRPTVTGVTEVTPSAPQDGQLVSLKVHFSEPVKELDGSFAGVSMTFSKASTDEAASVWQGVTTGPITVGAGNAIAELVLSQFKDVSNNNVESEYRQSYTVMPEISISDVSGDNRVETTELADVLFAGGTTGFASTGESVTLQVMRGATELINERVSVNGDGSWGYHANLSGEEIGDLTIRVNGSNRSGDPSSVAAEEATSSFTIIDLVRPTVTGVTEVTPSALQDGQLVSLTVHFSEPVKALVGSFAGVSMTFSKTSPDEAASEWQGVTNGPIRVGAGNAIAELVLSQFKDVSNNGVEHEYRQSYTVMPEISISDVSGDNRVETTELADVLIAGGTTGFASTGESVTLQVMRGATELINERLSVNGDGSWGYHANLSGEEIGDLTIKVNGSNRSGNPSSVAAEEATSSFTIIDVVAPIVSEGMSL